ncbi:MAG: hypothetical protein AAFV33_07300, partial [Chloroflexota bacterium]
MSMEMPLVLHISEYEPSPAVETAARTIQGMVEHTHDLQTALGAYIAYMPDIVVVEAPMGSWLGQESLYHLDSIDARPLVVLTDRRDLWDTEVVNGVYIRPLDVSGTALIATLTRAIG